jgi:hypothetical protein
LRLCSRPDDADEELLEVLDYRDLPRSARHAALLELARSRLVRGDAAGAHESLRLILSEDEHNDAATDELASLRWNDQHGASAAPDDALYESIAVEPDGWSTTLNTDQMRLQLSSLQAELCSLDAEIRLLRAGLDDFERSYLRSLGARLSKRDSLEASLAAAQALRDATEAAQNAASRANERAERTRRAATSVTGTTPSSLGEAGQRPYRRLALRLHPDFATDDQDRVEREELMKRLNSAMEAGCLDEIQHIDAETHYIEPSPSTDSTFQDSTQLRSAAQRIRRRLRARLEDLDRMKASPLYELYTRHEELSQLGRDLFVEIGAELDQQIALLEQSLRKLSHGD